MKTAYHPKPGDVVQLSDEGMRELSRLGVLRSYDAMERSKRMTIIYVTPESLTEPEPLWGVEVDHPEINEMLLHSQMFSLIERPAVPLPNKVQQPFLTLDQAVELGVATITHDGRGTVITIG